MTATVPPSKTVAALVRERAGHQGDRIVLAVDDGSTLTLAEWLHRSERVTAALLERGVEAGDRVALVVDDGAWIEYAVANLAIYLAGATAVGLTDRLGQEVLARRIAECEARAVLRTRDAVLAGRPGVGPAVGAVPAWDVRDLERGPDVPVPSCGPPSLDPVRPSAIAEIVYTSGTTGPAKRVAVTHANLTFGRDSRGELFGGIESILCAVPPGTNAGHSALMVALTTGSRAHVLGRIDADSMASAIERDAIQHAILPPGAAAALVTSGAHRRHDLSSLRALMFGSSAVPDRVVSALSEAVPAAQIMIGYGSTESAPAFARKAAPAWREHRDPLRYRRAGLESLGAPGGGTEVAITGPDGEPVPAGQVGEICLRCEAPNRYYLDRGPETAGVFGADGWVRMGDLGMIAPDGSLLFVDRVADSIVTSGHRISSAAVENALLWHPAVRGAAVFAIPDERAGQVAVAAVEAGPGTAPEHVARFLAGELDPADQPAAILIVPELPRGVTGKILKAQLRETYQGLRTIADAPGHDRRVREDWHGGNEETREGVPGDRAEADIRGGAGLARLGAVGQDRG
jgi:acyl-CoA synthetase (AMP-forming)/AMP-acid ligase II